jgi:hypothetical protein
MNAAEIRALLYKRELNLVNIDQSIPGVPELDGLLACIELNGQQTSLAEKLADTPQGTDQVLMMAAMVCQSLVTRDTKERIFSDADVEGVAKFGLSVLKPLSELVATASGLDAETLEAAKKNLKPIIVSSSNGSSPGISEATPTPN